MSTGPVYQLPRYSLLWVLASLSLVTLPHILRLPLWVTFLILACIIWRLLIYAGKASYPGKLIRISLVIGAIAAVSFEFRGRVGALDPTVTLLLLGFVFKLLEMQRKRDVYVVSCLSYIVLTSELFYSQDIPTAIYIAATIAVVNGTLISLNQEQGNQSTQRSIKLSLIVLAQSIPLTIILFVLVPRVAPLWSAQFQTTTAKTGVTDELSPGGISRLVNSGELAFRAKFSGETPSHEKLYWRGLTLDYFDGTTWSRNSLTKQEMQRRTRLRSNQEGARLQAQVLAYWQLNSEKIGDIVNYNIILEPTQQNWIYALRLPESNEPEILAGPNFDLYSKQVINQRVSYTLSSYLNSTTDLYLNEATRKLSLQLPDSGNESSRNFALQLRDVSGSAREYVQAILDHFSQQEFNYTLTPALLTEDRIDSFLFSTKEGYCEHYTSSFVFLMRAANVPARVIVGYQGAEYNPYDDYLMVHQYNAHSWAEVWLEDRGWVRVDPTAAVSPERISTGAEIVLATDPAFLQESYFSMVRFRDRPFLNAIRLRLDAIDYAWDRWVVSFDKDVQNDLWERLFGSVDQSRILSILFFLICAALGCMAYFMMRSGSRKLKDSVTIGYLRFCLDLEKLGFKRRRGEGPLDYCERVSEKRPGWSDSMHRITAMYIELAYQGTLLDERVSKPCLKLFKQSISNFRRMPG